MGDAAQIALTKEARRKNISFSTAATVAARFRRFAEYAKIKGVARMEDVTKAFIVAYGEGLARKVESSEMSASYAQNLLSAVNTVFRIVSPQGWASVSPTDDCGIAKRNFVRKEPTLDIFDCEQAVIYLRNKGLNRAACVAELGFRFGMRSKESSLFDAKKAEKEIDGWGFGTFTVEKGTKGGRKREASLQYREELEALNNAVAVQGSDRSIMPKEDTWKSWREHGLKKGREALHEIGIKGFHEFRAAYAAKRYKDIVIDWEAPCNGGVIFDKSEDLKARKIIAQELGHGRIDVVASYIGGRS